MNSVLLSIILIPIIEIYLFIKIGSQIGVFITLALVFVTAFVGIIYARYEGFNAMRSGFAQLVKNEVPIYEIISGASIAFGALLLILPGFATDFLGILMILPITRNIIFKNIAKKYNKKNFEKKNFVDGEFEDIEDEDEKKFWNISSIY